MPLYQEYHHAGLAPQIKTLELTDQYASFSQTLLALRKKLSQDSYAIINLESFECIVRHNTVLLTFDDCLVNVNDLLFELLSVQNKAGLPPHWHLVLSGTNMSKASMAMFNVRICGCVVSVSFR